MAHHTVNSPPACVAGRYVVARRAFDTTRPAYVRWTRPSFRTLLRPVHLRGVVTTLGQGSRGQKENTTLPGPTIVDNPGEDLTTFVLLSGGSLPRAEPAESRTVSLGNFYTYGYATP